MGFVSIVLGILGILMLSTCVVGGLCPRLLKDHKTGKIPKRNDMVLGGLILGLPLLGVSLYLAPSGLVEYFLLWAASIGLGCALAYGGFNAAKNARGLPEQASAAHVPLEQFRFKELQYIYPYPRWSRAYASVLTRFTGSDSGRFGTRRTSKCSVASI